MTLPARHQPGAVESAVPLSDPGNDPEQQLRDEVTTWRQLRAVVEAQYSQASRPEATAEDRTAYAALVAELRHQRSTVQQAEARFRQRQDAERQAVRRAELVAHLTAKFGTAGAMPILIARLVAATLRAEAAESEAGGAGLAPLTARRLCADVRELALALERCWTADEPNRLQAIREDTALHVLEIVEQHLIEQPERFARIVHAVQAHVEPPRDP